MSFSNFHRLIKENDTVIIYNKFNALYALEVKPQILNRHGQLVPNIFQTTYGALDVMALVGKEFGGRIQLTRGWTIALYPTPELWTLTLPHRTQILYSTDISMVIGRLNIGPGSVVCEAGTGSGSLSHAILRTLGPTGRLHTADFHQSRVEAARDEFQRHGLSERVECSCRDVITDGWSVTGAADAVFMDMPAPWLAIHHAVNAVNEHGGRICSFSPCIEQVSRTSTCMRKLGLQNIRTVEVLTRELQVKLLDLPVLCIKQDDRPLKKKSASNEDEPSVKKLKTTDDSMDNHCSPTEGDIESPPKQSSPTVMLNKAEDDEPNILPASCIDTQCPAVAPNDTSSCHSSNGLLTNKTESNSNVNGVSLPHKPRWSSLCAVPVFKQPGHTGFLTFCFVPPSLSRPVYQVKLEKEQKQDTSESTPEVNASESVEDKNNINVMTGTTEQNLESIATMSASESLR